MANYEIPELASLWISHVYNGDWLKYVLTTNRLLPHDSFCGH